MAFLNLMENKLKPKEVNDALSAVDTSIYDINEEIKNIKNSIASIDDASEISYDNTTSGLSATNVQSAIDEVTSKVDALGVEYVYTLTLINGWTGNVEVNVNSLNRVVAIQGYLDATDATSTTFCNGGTIPATCYNDKLLPVSGQGLSFKANSNQAYTIGFSQDGDNWVGVASDIETFAVVNTYVRA